MGIQQQDPEYLRAKYAFIRDLIQFHESRGTGCQCDPKINGKEIDLYLLYQIVTSHGGWEKINLRNEWDKLLEHFKLPRSTNGGLAIKQIYLRYLELYEKIHYLGEDVDTKEEPEDDYLEDFRGRRRYPNKLASSHHGHHSSSSSHHHHHPPKEITDHNRSQLGLSSRILECSDYEGLLLSLQSPLPNEQDMAISVCTLLSNETKHVLRFSKSPAILNMLLAHAGIYQDCGMRLLMEETYRKGRDMDYSEFWDEVLHQPDAKQLLCECFVKRMNASLGLTDDEGAIVSQIQEIEDGDLPEEEKHALGTALRLKLARLRESQLECADADEEEPGTSTNPTAISSPKREDAIESQVELSNGSEDSPKKETENGDLVPTTEDKESDCPVVVSGEAEECVKTNNADVSILSAADEGEKSAPEIKSEPIFKLCCSSCPCQRTENVPFGISSVEFSIERPSSKNGHARVDEAGDSPSCTLPFTLARAHQAEDKVGKRICQIAHILRNLSFEQDNALIMAKSPTLMRFILVAANCSFGSLAQASFDIIGNISSFIRLEEPLRDPLSSLFLTLVTSGVFSSDRFKILRSLESLRELTRVEGNEGIIARYIENRVYRRMCDLLTLSDIMLLIYTLECILSMTGLGEAVCDEIVRVQGSVATLVSLVTVEAQSYGPKGCILMRVVETVTGAATTGSGPSSSSSISSSTAIPASSSSSTTVATVNNPTLNSPLPPVQAMPQALSMVAVPQSPHAVMQPQSQHLLQQVLQQPPNPIYASSASGSTTPGRPSPASSPGLKIVTGTTVIPPVAHGQTGFQAMQQQQQQPKPIAAVPTHLLNPTINDPSGNSQVFSNPASSTNLINHLNSQAPFIPSQQYQPGQHPQVVAAVTMHPQQPHSVFPKASALPAPANRVQIINSTGASANDSIVASTPPTGATVVAHQQSKTVSLSNTIPPTAAVVPANPPGVGAVVTNATVNGALVTANLPQISNHHNMNQHHVVTPSISLVTPRGTLSEEAWSIAWLKGTFESASGTSIEQGEIYRMYSAARKNPNLVLSLEQFVQCVKCAYGASVGPVIKQFGGGTSLPFFEGIKPKIAIRAVAVTGASGATTIKVTGPGGNAIAAAVAAASNTNSQHQVTSPSVPVGVPVVHSFPASLPPPQPSTIIPSIAPSISKDGDSTNALVDSTLSHNNNSALNNSSGGGATLPVSVHIPSREANPSLSPILQATLSQPPKAKSNSTCGAAPATLPTPGSNNNNATIGSTKRVKTLKGKDCKKLSSATGRHKKGTVVPENIDAMAATASTSSNKTVSCSKAAESIFSPASSAIRSLLASKVVQRQQSKLQQQMPKTLKSKLGDKQNSTINSIEDGVTGYPSSEIVKVNGIGPETGIEKMEESSASSSLLSNDGSDNNTKSALQLTSFHGVLHNGQANSDFKNELNLDGSDDSDNAGKKGGAMKGMLIDLLERRVPSREPVNGMMTGREIRISDKGLELIDKMEETLGNPEGCEPTLVNHSGGDNTSATGNTFPPNDVQESQKMTFYSSTSDAQVTLQGQASTAACVIPGSVLSGSAVTLASGGGGGVVGDGTPSSIPPTSENAPLTLRTASGQQVKFCGGKFVRLIEPISEDGGASTTTAIATTATLVATSHPTLPAIAAVQVSSNSAATATFSFVDGDGLVGSCSAAAASCPTVVAAPPNGDVTYFMGDDTIVGQIVEVVDTVIADDIASSFEGGCGLDFAVAAHGNIICNNEDGDGDVPMIVDEEVTIESCNVNSNSSASTTSNLADSNCSNGGGGDMLEKFSEFSDLIVLPPEQLAGLKRPSSPLPTTVNMPGNNNNNNSADGDDMPPPAKRMAVDNNLVESDSATGNINNNKATSLPMPVPVVTSAGSASTIPQSLPNNINMATNNQAMISTATSVVASTTTTPSLPPGSGAQVVQLPLRLSVNPQNPQQLTFTRQLVLPTGQQLLLSTGNSQSPLQGQMIISKSQGTTNDQMPKAIIILQQQQQQATTTATGANPQPVVTTASIQNIHVPVSVPQLQNMVVSNSVVPAMATQQQQVTRPAMHPPSKPQIVAVQQHSTTNAGRLQAPTGPIVQSAQTPLVHQVVTSTLHHASVQQQQHPHSLHVNSPQLHHVPHHHPSSQIHALAAIKQQAASYLQFEGLRGSNFPQLTQDQLDLEFPFLCEWAGCSLRFLRPQQVSMHALKVHCPEALVDAVRCEWGQNGCDPLLRKRFSLMTHLQDRHCSKQALEMALYRRKNKIEPPPVPQQPIHHPGYAPNAAFHAIKRHAMSFMSTKEHLHDDNEGPVTKSIRLTSALILRNLVNYSGLGRRMLQGYESHLSAIAMSNVESSRTIAQLLHDMNDQPKSSKGFEK